MTGLQHRPVLVAKERYEQLTLQIASIRLPIDIEPARIFRLWTPFQHVEPPRVVGAANADMVGYEIQHLPETVVAKRRHHLTEGRLVAELRVELAVVDDVIAMCAAGTRFQVRRGVNVADAQPGRERGLRAP